MEHEKFEGERTLMRIHIGESDKWHGKALYSALVELIRGEGLSGVTVLRGVAGYGSTSRLHTDKVLRLRRTPDYSGGGRGYRNGMERFFPKLDEMIGGGLITLERVRVILYRSQLGVPAPLHR